MLQAKCAYFAGPGFTGATGSAGFASMGSGFGAAATAARSVGVIPSSPISSNAAARLFGESDVMSGLVSATATPSERRR